MKLKSRILLLASIALIAVSCKKAESGSTEAVIASKNIDQMQQRKVALEAEIAQLDDALSKMDTKAPEEALVAVVAVKDTVFNHYIEVQGNVATDQNLIIYPQYSGVLTNLSVKAGQKVSKGQVLGRIDDGGLSSQVAQLENQLALAKTTFERQKRLWDQKIGSEIQFLQAQTNMVSQQKAVAQIKAQLNKTVITAPFSGVIDEIITDQGQVVGPGQGLMRIVNLGDMYITTSVPESYIGKVKVGTTVDISIGGLGKTYTGKVRQVANNINATNRTFNIEVSVPNKDNLLRPNQVAKLKIIDYNNKGALVVPTNVVQEDGEGNKFVFVVADASKSSGKAKKAIVKVGPSADNMTEIIDGLNVGDLVVTEGANTISEGMKLNY